MKDWIECNSCWAEFKVISDSDELPEFCPYCGSDIDPLDEDDEDEDNEYDD